MFARTVSQTDKSYCPVTVCYVHLPVRKKGGRSFLFFLHVPRGVSNDTVDKLFCDSRYRVSLKVRCAGVLHQLCVINE